MRSKLGTPLSSQHTASPSMMQEREHRRSNGSTISGKRPVKSLPVEPHPPVALASNDAKAVVRAELKSRNGYCNSKSIEKPASKPLQQPKRRARKAPPKSDLGGAESQQRRKHHCRMNRRCPSTPFLNRLRLRRSAGLKCAFL